MSEILPPDAPDDIWPVPYERRRVDRALPLRKNQTASLKEVGVQTMKDLDTWFMRGGKLTDLAGIGPKTEETILEAYNSLRATVDFVRAARKDSA